jgi:hypothetical protein
MTVRVLIADDAGTGQHFGEELAGALPNVGALQRRAVSVSWQQVPV